MKKNKKQLSIFKRIGLIAIALFSALGSLLLPFASKNQNNFASADTTSSSGVTFNSSDIFYCRLGNKLTSSVSQSSLVQFSNLLSSSAGSSSSSTSYNQVRFNFRIEKLNVLNSAEQVLNFYIYGRANSYNGTAASSSSARGFVQIGSSQLIPYGLDVSLISSCVYQAGSSSENGYTLFGASIHSPVSYSSAGGLMRYAEPTLEMISIEIGNYSEFASFSLSQGYIDAFDTKFSNSNIICYTDTNGWKYCFYIPNWGTDYVEGYLHYRKYYTDKMDFFSDNEIYNEGYQNGLVANQQNVYDNGYASGKIAGEAIGYDKGILEANDYSFKSLFGAVIDAPIKAFSGMFNFEFLGVNLLDFFFGLLTFGVIIFVIKLLLGGK